MDSEAFENPLLRDVQFDADGSLKATGKQQAKFYNRKMLSFRAKVDENGQPKIDPKTGLPFKEAYEQLVEFVRVETKGDTNIVDEKADEFKKRQFYRQYKHFREGRIPDGNPIDDFEFIQPGVVMELHMLGIHVIQQMAEMSDLVCERLKDQSGYELRDIAAQWVKINSPQGQNAKAERLELEVTRLKRELQELKGGRVSVSHPPAASDESEAPAADEPIKTMELTPEQLAAKRRPRKV